MNHTLIIKIKNNLFTKSNTLNAAIIRPDRFVNTELYKEILANTEWIQNENIGERIYCLLNNIIEQPKCPSCGKILRFITYSLGYSKSCNNMSCLRKLNIWTSCSKTKLNKNIELQNIFFKNYQRKNYSKINNDIIINFINQRIQETNFGMTHQFINLQYFKNYPEILYNILEKTENLKPIDMYNWDWSERFYILLNNISKIPKCKYCQENTKYINIKQGYQPYCSKKCLYEYQIKQIKEKIQQQGFIIQEEFTNIQDKNIQIKCIKCGKIIFYNLSNGRSSDIYCAGCYQNIGISKEEKKVVEYLKTIYSGNIFENYKIENKELDIYLQDKNLAIEYNGLYWHSFDDIHIEQTKKYNHSNKTKLCNQKNITLLHIFSNEWNNENTCNIWKSIIKNKLGLCKRIFARKCKIFEISNIDKNNFLQKNHLQGEDISSIRLGLFYENILVAVMTFSKSRYNKNYEWEMVRYCCQLDYNIIGGASKLLKYFEKKYSPKSLITYADKRYSCGNLYKILGFTYLHETQPNYFYWHRTKSIILSRITCQKHKLKTLLKEQYNEKLSESENMFNANYRRFWDCGNLVFIKNYQNDKK
jgi:hypothetical protein